MRRHQLQHEGETEEHPTTPPTDLGQKVSGLANTDESVRRRAGAAEARGQPATLSALKENRQHDDHAVDDEQC